MTLIDRLSKLDGPDRELDVELWLLNTPGATRKWTEIKSANNRWKPYTIDETRDETGRLVTVPAYTASIDDAIVLADRVLPRYRWSAGFSRHVPHNAQIWVPSGSGYYEGESDANRAIALCIAILRAKEASKP